jgi:hypothetical protein
MLLRRPFVSTVALVAVSLLMVGASVGFGRSASTTPSAAGGNVPASPRAASVLATTPRSGSIGYGLAEPAGTLPGSSSAEDRAAWSQIRADVLSSGSCWLRTDLDSWLTRALDAFGWLGSPAACSTSADAPIKVLAILDDQTVWAAPFLCPGSPFSATFRAHRPDFTLDDWQLIVRCIARRYAGRISAYEVWNEPEIGNSDLGYQDGSAAHYVDLLRLADVEIKAADPNATVVALGGSDLYAGGDQTRLARMRAFTTDLTALGAPRYADAISLRAYPWGRSDASVWGSYDAELRFQEQAWQRPAWITETGTRASENVAQGAYLEAAYSLFVRDGVQTIFWFSITDQRDGDFGLRGRPVAAVLHAFTAANP